jgi:hypothetical protein
MRFREYIAKFAKYEKRSYFSWFISRWFKLNKENALGLPVGLLFIMLGAAIQSPAIAIVGLCVIALFPPSRAVSDTIEQELKEKEKEWKD